MSHRAWGLFLAITLAVGLAIWQPWKGSQLDPPRARTVVLLTIDALRRDHVGAYTPETVATPRATTPTMNRLAKRAIRFEDARTPVPLTLPSHTTMLAGRSPAQTGVRLNSMRVPAATARPYRLLPEILQAAGWRTGAFVSAATLASDRGLDAGFEVYDDGGLGDAQSGLMVPERRGDETIASVETFLASVASEDRVFLFVHLFEPHFPYNSGSYAADVEDADRIVGRLLRALEAVGRSDAAILLTADHGEALGELGEMTHGILLSDGAMRVPMLLALPNEAFSVRSDPVDVADIAPTLATLAAVAWPDSTGPGAGHDLLAGPLPADRTRVAESLFGHHRYGWAQLVGAVRPDGVLVDAGAGRPHWLPVQPYGRDLLGTLPGSQVPDIGALNKVLLDYKAAEASDLMQAGPRAGGYGAGGRVAPFLPDEENAALGDPHDLVTNADLLNAIAARVEHARQIGDRAVIHEAVREIRRLLRADERNREAWFRLGRAYQSLGEAAEAETNFLKAWELGRRDEGTLIACCGVNAVDREADMLLRLEDLGNQIDPWTFQMWLLAARFHRTLGDTEAYRAACDEARRLASSERDQARLAGTCGDGG